MSKYKNRIGRLDKLWSQGIVKRDKSICQKCGKWAENPHHIFYRRKKNTRWLLQNGINLCESCHVLWAHAEPEEFLEWWIDYVGVEVYTFVEAESLKVKPDLDEIERNLKEFLSI